MKRVISAITLILAAALWFYHSPDQQPTFTITATPVAVTPVPTTPSAPQPQIQPTTPVAHTAKAFSPPQVAASTAATRMPVIKGKPRAPTLRERMRSPETLGKIVDDVYDALCVKGPTNGDRSHCDGTEEDINLADIILGMYAACEEEQDCKDAIARIYNANRRNLISTFGRSAEEEENVEMEVGAAISESILNISTSICAEQNLAVGSVLGEGSGQAYKACVPPHNKLANL